MPTTKQRRLAKVLLETASIDNPPTASEMLVNVGYAKSVAEHKPKEILEAQGVKDALAEYGLTEELISTALVNDINAKPKRRIKELELGADILGMRKKDEQNNQKILIVNVLPQSSTRYASIHGSPGVDNPGQTQV